MIGPAGGGGLAFTLLTAASAVVVSGERRLKHLMTDGAAHVQLIWARTSSCHAVWSKSRKAQVHTHTHDKYTNRRYLYSLAIVDFNYVEVKTVNSFPWCNEVTSLFVKIPPNIYKNLKDRQTERNSLVQALCHAVRNTTATNSKYFYFKTDLMRKQTNLCCPL